MKIRIKGNSLRYRLTKTDIASFGATGRLEERTTFAEGNSFVYALQCKPGIDQLEAEFSNGIITVFVPESMTKSWTTTDVIGYSNRDNTDNNNKLIILVEKDFVCLDHSFEDQSDNYPNPNKTC